MPPVLFRLVCQSRSFRPGGVFAGVDNKYVLQFRESVRSRWRTLPVVDWDSLTPLAKSEMAADLQAYENVTRNTAGPGK